MIPNKQYACIQVNILCIARYVHRNSIHKIWIRMVFHSVVKLVFTTWDMQNNAPHTNLFFLLYYETEYHWLSQYQSPGVVFEKISSKHEIINKYSKEKTNTGHIPLFNIILNQSYLDLKIHFWINHSWYFYVLHIRAFN